VIRAIRPAVGPDIAVMVDYNQSLDVAQKARLARPTAGPRHGCWSR
jgi:L-alanine-DL-glutamate epimerase-like enolase superfamily enzyme